MTAVAELIAEFRSLAQSLEPAATEALSQTLDYIVVKNAALSVGILGVSLFLAILAQRIFVAGKKCLTNRTISEDEKIGINFLGALCLLAGLLLIALALPDRIASVFEPLGALIASRL